MPERIAVGSGGSAYDVVIGADDPPSLVADLLDDAVRRVLVVHALPVSNLALRIGAALRASGRTVHLSDVPDGEAAKTSGVAADLWEQLGRAGFTRSDAVVTVGGGAVTDLGGFVAATWLRGVAVVHVPTTLLAMVDAAVGGKTGINTPQGKNLVGAFHPPAGVVVDLRALTSLPRPDLVAGLAEVVKGGFIADETILDLIETHPAAAVDPTSDVFAAIVARKIAVKARVVTADLTEASLREILNYGHTFAHAIEQISGYTWRHGDAVALGMLYAAHLARIAGRLDEADVERHERILAAVELPVAYTPGAGAGWEDHLAVMRRDKKTRGDLLRFVVLAGVEQPERLEGPPESWLRGAWEAVTAT